MLRERWAMARAALADAPADLMRQSDAAAAAESLARLFVETNRPADALPLLRDAARHMRPLAAAHPQNGKYASVLGRILDQLAFALTDAGATAEAEPVYREAIAGRRRPGAPALQW